MIFALRHPSVLLGLLLGFFFGIALRAAAQRLVVRAPGASRRLRAVGGRRPGLQPGGGWAGYLDPYGTVAAVISGVGWGPRPELRRRNGDILALLAALAVHAALAAAGFAAAVAAGVPREILGLIDPTWILQGSRVPADLAQSVTLGFGMINLACGLLVLLPIPPLEMGVVLWSRLPRGPGARRLAYRLLEEQWGIGIVLLLVLLPLAGQQPVILALINTIGRAILGAF